MNIPGTDFAKLEIKHLFLEEATLLREEAEDDAAKGHIHLPIIKRVLSSSLKRMASKL